VVSLASLNIADINNNTIAVPDQFHHLRTMVNPWADESRIHVRDLHPCSSSFQLKPVICRSLTDPLIIRRHDTGWLETIF
jgi:hypothetical protein